MKQHNSRISAVYFHHLCQLCQILCRAGRDWLVLAMITLQLDYCNSANRLTEVINRATLEYRMLRCNSFMMQVAISTSYHCFISYTVNYPFRSWTQFKLCLVPCIWKFILEIKKIGKIGDGITTIQIFFWPQMTVQSFVKIQWLLQL